MHKKKLTDKDKKEFESAWDRYWYHIKPVSSRLVDDMNEEFEICSKFFCAMKNLK